MPSSTSPHSGSRQPAPTRLKLTMPSPDRPPPPLRESDTWQRQNVDADHHSSTPPRPSYSPVTPTSNFGPLALAAQGARQPTTEWMEEPLALPVSMEENPDAIALRATIGILQLQREQSLRHIRQLDKIKTAALNDPHAFLDDLKAGKLTKTSSSELINLDRAHVDEDDMSDHGQDNTPDQARSVSDQSRFGTFPIAQNVVRYPPINWAKYRIAGESLDKVHEEQRKRPSVAGLGEDELERPPEHVVAAPYRAFVDKLEHPPLARSEPDRI